MNANWKDVNVRNKRTQCRFAQNNFTFFFSSFLFVFVWNQKQFHFRLQRNCQNRFKDKCAFNLNIFSQREMMSVSMDCPILHQWTVEKIVDLVTVIRIYRSTAATLNKRKRRGKNCIHIQPKNKTVNQMTFFFLF